MAKIPSNKPVVLNESSKIQIEPLKSEPLPSDLSNISTEQLRVLSKCVPYDNYFNNIPYNSWANEPSFRAYLNYGGLSPNFNPHVPIFNNNPAPFTMFESMDLEKTKRHENYMNEEFAKFDRINEELKRRCAKEKEYEPNFTMYEDSTKQTSLSYFIDDVGDYYTPFAEKMKYSKEEGYYARYNKYLEIKDEYFLIYLSSLLDMLKPKLAPVGKRGKPCYNDRDMLFCSIYTTYMHSNPRKMVGHFPNFYTKNLILNVPRHRKIWETIEKPEMTPILQALVQLSAFPMLLSEDIMAVDSSGFTTITRGEYRVDKYVYDMDGLPKRKKNGQPVLKTKKELELEEKERMEWMKLHIIIGVETGAIGMAEVTNYYGEGVGDSTLYPTLLKGVTDLFHAFRIEVPMKFVTGDKAYGGESNYEYTDKQKLILLTPFKDNVDTTTKTSVQWLAMYDFCKEHPIRWGKTYHKRSNVESQFHSIKSMFGERLTEHKDESKMNKLYMKAICHNITHLILYNVLNGFDVNFNNYDYTKYSEHLKRNGERAKLNRLESSILRDEELKFKQKRAEQRRANKQDEKIGKTLEERSKKVLEIIGCAESEYVRELMKLNLQTEIERNNIILQKILEKEEKSKVNRKLDDF